MTKTTRHTAIQLRDDHRVRCSMVYGKATRITPGIMGKIALVDDGCLVGYHIVNGNRECAFLFRADVSRGALNMPFEPGFTSAPREQHRKGQQRSRSDFQLDLQVMAQLITDDGLEQAMSTYGWRTLLVDLDERLLRHCSTKCGFLSKGISTLQ